MRKNEWAQRINNKLWYVDRFLSFTFVVVERAYLLWAALLRSLLQCDVSYRQLKILTTVCLAFIFEKKGIIINSSLNCVKVSNVI